MKYTRKGIKDMKRQIRRGVFETNSSSTHSLTICSAEEFERWERGELLYNKWEDEEFIEIKRLVKEYENDAEKEYREIQGFLKNWSDLSESEREQYCLEYMRKHYIVSEGYETFEKWEDDEFLETYSKEYTTENGDKVVAFGKYGWNG